MIMTIPRDVITDVSTGGVLSIDGKFFCYTLEDKDRKLEINPGDKVYGKSAIPRGTYKVVMDYSPKYKKMMPHILDVPGFSGIRFHPGNTIEDTDGCVLLGDKRAYNTVIDSKIAFDRFVSVIRVVTEPIQLTIS